MRKMKRARLVRDEFERDVFYIRHRLSCGSHMPAVRVNGRWIGYWRASHLFYCTNFRCREAPRNDSRWRKRTAFERRIKYGGSDIPF